MPAIVEHKMLIKLDDQTVKRLFMEHLEHLTQGRWIEGDDLREEAYTSHRFDRTVGSIDDPQYLVCVAAIRLKNALAERDAREGAQRLLITADASR